MSTLIGLMSSTPALAIGAVWLTLSTALLAKIGFRRKPMDPARHPFVPYSKANGDVRSPCPALNTLANHGYINHSGRDISPFALTSALIQCYNLSPFLAAFITFGGYFLTGQFFMMSLHDLRRHNGIEHSTSLVHKSPKCYGPLPDQMKEYAPWRMDTELWQKLVADCEDGETVTVHDIAKARVRREREDCVPIDGKHKHIARGEIGLVLDIFGGPARRVSLDLLHAWWTDDRFPDNWEPTRVQTFSRTGETNLLIGKEMTRIRKVQAADAAAAAAAQNGNANGNGNGYAPQLQSSSAFSRWFRACVPFRIPA